MNSIEESGHVQRVFEIYGYDEAKKLNLVADLRDVAIEHLKPVMANVPRGMPERIKAAYQAKGISIEWDLPADALEFCLQAQNAGLSESQRSACALLYSCTEALDKEAVPPSLQQSMVKAFAGLDADYVAIGRKRRRQTKDWGKRGAAARTKYSDADKAEWTRLAAEHSATMSHSETARRIAKRLGLPEAATGTIRKEIAKARSGSGDQT